MNQIVDNTNTEPVQQRTRAFPVEGTNLSRILTDPLHRRKFHAQLKRYNPLVVAFYRVGLMPLFGVSRTVMLLTTKGKKSGKLRSTPIGYFRIGGALHLFSAWGKSASWYKNMTANPNDIWVQVGLRKQRVTAQTLEEPAEILRTLEQFVAESPSQAQYLFGWEPDRDRMDQADFSAVINQVLIVRFKVPSTKRATNTRIASE